MCSSLGEDCSKIELCGSLHQLEEHAQCLVKLTVFRCAESVVLPYSVLMNCITRGFYSFRPGVQGKRDGIPRMLRLSDYHSSTFSEMRH